VVGYLLVAPKRREEALKGLAAARTGGPFNPRGRPAVYAATSPGAAAFFALYWLNTRPEALRDYEVLRLVLPKDARVVHHHGREFALEVGSRFLAEARALALVFPAGVLPAERGLLINPRHPAFAWVEVTSLGPLFNSR